MPTILEGFGESKKRRGEIEGSRERRGRHAAHYALRTCSRTIVTNLTLKAAARPHSFTYNSHKKTSSRGESMRRTKH